MFDNEIPPIKFRDPWASDAQNSSSGPARPTVQTLHATNIALRASFNMTPGPAAMFNNYSGLNPAAAHYVPSASSPLISTHSVRHTRTDSGSAIAIHQTAHTPLTHGPIPMKFYAGSQPRTLQQPAVQPGREDDDIRSSHFSDPFGVEKLLAEDDASEAGTEIPNPRTETTFSRTGPWFTRMGSTTPTHASTQDRLAEMKFYMIGAQTDLSPDDNARHLASQILRGLTESPPGGPRRTEEKQTNSRQPIPTLGPARFKRRDTDASVGSSSSHPEAQASFPRRTPAQPYVTPAWFDSVKRNAYLPTLQEALDALPLAELGRMEPPSQAGVLRIRDIPYASTRAEIVALVGRNAQIVAQPPGSQFHAVHIIMERETGKTMDCFVEVATTNEAAYIARNFERRAEAGRAAKVGDRIVDIVCSTHEEMMTELFPRAKYVSWHGATPVIDMRKPEYYEGVPAAGFKGFIDPEEFVALSKHAELDARAPFASRSPCRIYEAIISMVHKYPWHAVEHITLGERRSLFDLLFQFMRQLANSLRRGGSSHPGRQFSGNSNKAPSPRDPTTLTLHELSIAGLTCPGFSERQKLAIVTLLVEYQFEEFAYGHSHSQQQRTSASLNLSLGGQHGMCQFWPFQILCVQPGSEPDVVNFYAFLFRAATVVPQGLSFAERHIARTQGQNLHPMGQIAIDYGPNPAAVTLAAAARLELAVIEKILTRVLSTATDVPNTPTPRRISNPIWATPNAGLSATSTGPHAAGEFSRPSAFPPTHPSHPSWSSEQTFGPVGFQHDPFKATGTTNKSPPSATSAAALAAGFAAKAAFMQSPSRGTPTAFSTNADLYTSPIGRENKAKWQRQ